MSADRPIQRPGDLPPYWQRAWMQLIETYAKCPQGLTRTEIELAAFRDIRGCYIRQAKDAIKGDDRPSKR